MVVHQWVYSLRLYLPLSKAALASIGLDVCRNSSGMIILTSRFTSATDKLYNFQIKLRNMVMDSDIPNDDSVDPNTISSASVTIVAILPFA